MGVRPQSIPTHRTESMVTKVSGAAYIICIVFLNFSSVNGLLRQRDRNEKV